MLHVKNIINAQLSICCCLVTYLCLSFSNPMDCSKPDCSLKWLHYCDSICICDTVSRDGD